jgi:hypothetical protein
MGYEKLLRLSFLSTCLIGAAHAQILAPIMSGSGSSSGSLVCNGFPCPVTNSSRTALNLTSLGTTDWYSPGGTISAGACPDTERKSGGGSLIGAYTLGGGATAIFNVNLSWERIWTNGTPDGSNDDTSSNGVGCGIGATPGYGISTTCPASTALHHCIVYLSTFGTSDYTLTAHLSDSSASDYVDTEMLGSDGEAYDLYYKAASNGQTLTVTVVQDSSAQDLFLQGVAYQ